MSEPVSRDTELKGHEEIVKRRSKIFVPAAQNAIDYPRIADARQKVVDYHPLVVTPQELARFVEGPPGCRNGVVCSQKRNVQLSNDQILVITRISDKGRAIHLFILISRPTR